MEKEKALEIINKEKDYEDKLVNNITIFLEESLHSIEGLFTEEKEEIEKTLSQISSESKKHAQMFEGLINLILENGKDQY